ncbi:MAG TPA: SRPBCC family protein [Mycobacteriales bacterium]|nr:SRPBCC family protein [Mycobacteriales bacterium]
MKAARAAAIATGGAAVVSAGYLGLVSGAVPIDLGIGRRTRSLGPLSVDIDAERHVVMDVIAEPYLGRATRAMQEKVQVLVRGTDVVLAAHRTPIRGGLTAITTETVRFVGSERVEFRLVRGPVPHVVETFELTPRGDSTVLDYTGEMGADLWRLGQWWAGAVAASWERVVAASLAAIKSEAELRAGRSKAGLT